MKKKNKKQRKSKLNLTDIESSILEIFQSNPNIEESSKQIAYRLDLKKKNDLAIIWEAIEILLSKGKIKETRPWKYILAPTNQTSLEGVIEITRAGYGFVSCEGLKEDIFIPAKKTNRALNKDKVKIIILPHKSKGEKLEGEVVEVIERKQTTFVGVLEITNGYAFLVPDNPKIHIDFYIPKNNVKKAKTGEKAIVELEEWEEGRKNPTGKIVKILGEAGKHEVEMNAIIEGYGLPYEFPASVTKQAEAITSEIPDEEIKSRKDFRKVTTFTIDPADAKDFDDAISVKSLENEQWEIGVHIADVSYYLRPDSELDKEAYRRGTSVYLVDRVVPMLPEKLSNELCSLRPDEDKLCFSAVFTLDKNAEIIKQWFGRTIIHSKRRFSYDEVQEIIETKKGDLKKEILTTHTLASILRSKRFSEGAFNFETEEVKFRLDEKGHPVEVIKKVSKEANWLIEEFMLLANKKVAEIFSKDQGKNYSFPYRIHDFPEQSRLSNFTRLASQLGYHLNISNNKKLAQSVNKLIIDIQGKPEQNFLQNLAIRSMAKASYSPENIGHFGLAFTDYTHFTSPIRRYPDLIVHRVLADYLNHKSPFYSAEKLKVICKQSSEREINAESAERASIKYKQIEYLQDKVNQIFGGVINGVTEAGLFVELLENKCEGLVRLSSINDDYYIVEEENYLAKGFKTGKIYRLGQLVKVKIIAASLSDMKVDFILAE